ncbi:MAG TPA: PrsW family glutamic-type intramembrane protease [Solirubrobacteraceae bacterium]|jgi:RsiW-degrading membrane proteinase PrsW (M82 family)
MSDESTFGARLTIAGQAWRWDGRRWVLSEEAPGRPRLVVAADDDASAAGGPVAGEPPRLPLAVVLPLRRWSVEKPWNSPQGIAFAAFALGPVVLVATGPDIRAASWAISLYFAAVWYLVLQRLIRPEPLARGLQAQIAVATGILGVLLAAGLERELAFGPSLVGATFGIGVPEELVKLAPVAIAGFVGGVSASPAAYLFLGTISGLSFGVAEAVVYSTGASVTGYAAEDSTGFLLTEFYRFVGDSLFHACTAGIACYFVGLALAFRTLARPLVTVGLVLTAVAHGAFDSFAFSGALWPCVVIEALIVLCFLSYVYSARDIATALGARLVGPPPAVALQSGAPVRVREPT